MKGLENLTEFVEKWDEGILRGYSKITKKWEDKGHNKYSLSGLCDVSGVLILDLFQESNIIKVCLGFNSGVSVGNSIVGLATGKHLTGVKEENGKFIVNNKLAYLIDQFGKIIRTPELIAGIGFAGKGIYDFYNYFANKDSSSLSEGIQDLGLGVSLVSNASAWFIRDSNPKLLDQKPFWKIAYEKIRGEPQTELIPIKVEYSKPL